jgi:predicted HicB family RNase H-like nuclease
MNITAILETLQSDVETAAEGTEGANAQAVIRLGRLLQASVRVELLDALSESAAELSDQLPSGRVEVRVAGSEVSLTFVREQDEPAEVTPDEDSARITLRIPESLKTAAEAAAGREGLSTNAWLVRAVKRGLGDRQMRGHRVRGFAQS